jgi:Flp pilus assembly protein CpaB
MKNQKLIYIAVAIIVVAVLGYFGYKAYQAKQATPEAQAAKLTEQKNTIINKIKQLTVLPSEEPVLFTVNDAALLKSQQAFFKDSENGDVLLVFQTSGKALIYRESTNKIVNSGPVSFQQPAAGTPKTGTPAPTVKK